MSEISFHIFSYYLLLVMIYFPLYTEIVYNKADIYCVSTICYASCIYFTRIISFNPHNNPSGEETFPFPGHQMVKHLAQNLRVTSENRKTVMLTITGQWTLSLVSPGHTSLWCQCLPWTWEYIILRRLRAVALRLIEKVDCSWVIYSTVELTMLASGLMHLPAI